MTSIHFRDVGFGFVDTKGYFEQIIVEFSLQSHKIWFPLNRSYQWIVKGGYSKSIKVPLKVLLMTWGTCASRQLYHYIVLMGAISIQCQNEEEGFSYLQKPGQA